MMGFLGFHIYIKPRIPKKPILLTRRLFPALINCVLQILESEIDSLLLSPETGSEMILPAQSMLPLGQACDYSETVSVKTLLVALLEGLMGCSESVPLPFSTLRAA